MAWYLPKRIWWRDKMRRDKVDPTEEDIQWYYTSAHSELGIKSNLGSVLERAKLGIDGGRGVQTDGAMVGRLQAAERYRDIHYRIEQLTAKTRRVLEDAYEERQLPISLRLTFHAAAGIAIRMPLARRAHKAACDKLGVVGLGRLTIPEWLARTVVLGTKTDKAVVEIVRERAVKLLDEAYKAYRLTTPLHHNRHKQTHAVVASED
jgi:hypothetical protein